MMTPDREAELIRLVLAMADKIYLMSSHLSRLAERRHQGGLTMSRQTCENCKYFESGLDDDLGTCRRYPPVFIGDSSEELYGLPPVAVIDWCGEWKAKEGDGGNRVAE